MHAPPPRSALLVAWGSAWLAGEVSLDELVSRAQAHDDHHVVTGLGADGLDLGRALAQLRAGAVLTLRLVLPAPGDPVGLPGPGPFSSAALVAGEGVLALRADGSGTGLVPVVGVHGSALDGTVTSVRWTAYDVAAAGPDPTPLLGEAELELRQGLAEAARALEDLDVARWRPEVAGRIEGLRARARLGRGEAELPECYPPKARQVLARADQVAGLLELAGPDPGGALDTREAAAREGQLRRLATLVRRARVAAYNAHPPSGEVRHRPA